MSQVLSNPGSKFMIAVVSLFFCRSAAYSEVIPNDVILKVNGVSVDTHDRFLLLEIEDSIIRAIISRAFYHSVYYNCEVIRE